MKKFVLFPGVLFVSYLIGISPVFQYIELQRTTVKAQGPYQVSPALPHIFASIKHVRDQVEEPYVAWGSDLGGSVAVPFDITRLAGFFEDKIRTVMGERVKHFILQKLR